jgi:C-terminal processing protease CtpA/Prc
MPGDPRADTSDIDAYMAALTDIYAAEFDKVREDAVAVVWDVRGNIGGASPVGFAIAGGMPGAHEVAIARCTTKVPGSSPPEFYELGPDYDLTPDPRFAFEGPVAVLIDGLAISAADYFARAVRLGTDALLVGRPSAGAYGGGGAYESLYEPLGLIAAYDPYRCNDVDGRALETHSVEPDVWVEYAPADVAAGRDTVLETAVARLLAP